MALRRDDIIWDEGADGMLMQLVSQSLSFTQIGERLGISRNAASARFRRLRAAMGWQAA